eukprot:gene9240-10215_t
MEKSEGKEENQDIASSVNFPLSMCSVDVLLNLTKRKASLPKTGGLKDHTVDKSSEQKISNYYEQLQSILSEERVCKLGSLSTGTWLEEESIVRVDKSCGHYWQLFGFVVGGILYAKPEEALFLLEQGLLEIYFSGLPLSLQQAWMLLMAQLPSMEYYSTFVHLCRCGYVVMRSAVVKGVKVKPAVVKGVEMKRVDIIQESKDPNFMETEPTFASTASREGLKRSSDDSDQAWHREMGPDFVEFEGNELKMIGASLLKSQDISNACRFATDPLSTEDNQMKVVEHPVVESDKDLTLVKDQETQSLSPTFFDENKPLLSPENRMSKDEVMSKLQIVKSRSVPVGVSAGQPSTKSQCLDVYQKVGFKKSCPGDPDFRVAVFGYNDPPPNSKELNALLRNACGIPLKLAVCNGATVTFYGIFDVDVSKTIHD